MVGVACAAVAARVTGTEPTVGMWVGAVIASGAPDLDMIAVLLGFKGPKYHRNATHSLFVLAAVVAAGWWAIDAAGWPVAAGVRWAWAAALFSHPLLDVVTTGPDIIARGFGIPLFWPFSRHRYSVARPIMETLEVETVESVGDVLRGMAPELTRLVPLAALVVVIALYV